MQGGQQIVFVVECCQNCKDCCWHTRHDEAKYQEFFKKVAGAIIDRIPNAMVMKNQIPKDYLNFDLYNNLIQNDDEGCPYFQQVPRTGAFEVSYKGMLVFSKLRGGYWPNCGLIGDKCSMIVQDEAAGRDCTQYLAGNTPIKGGGYVQSTARKREPRSPGKTSSKAANSSFQQAPANFDNSMSNSANEQLKVHENNPPLEDA